MEPKIIPFDAEHRFARAQIKRLERLRMTEDEWEQYQAWLASLAKPADAPNEQSGS